MIWWNIAHLVADNRPQLYIYMMEIKRLGENLLQEHLRESPAVWIRGARQVGKSTLAKMVAGEGRTYITFDDPAALALATADPTSFILDLTGDVILDEVQRVPHLFRAIKLAVDEDRRPGRFVLTGSANVFALPQASESLAGRLQILSLEPFAQAEIRGTSGAFIEKLFAKDFELSFDRSADLDKESIWSMIAIGGYPESRTRKTDASRYRMFTGYVNTLLERDVRDISDIKRLNELPGLLEVLAARASSLLNLTDISRTLNIPRATLDRYLKLLEALFIYRPLRSYSGNVVASLTQAPKVQLLDTGLAAYSLGLSSSELPDHRTYGMLLESFVGNELRRLLTWHERVVRMSHFRTKHGKEVDFVLSDQRGKLVGIEVKAGRAVNPKDFSGLEKLKELTGDNFKRGIILYSGTEVFKRGDFYAVPLSVLWG